MDHETLKRMERAVLEEWDGDALAELESDLAAHPEALERVRALGALASELRDMPLVPAPPDMAARVVGSLRSEADSRLNALRRCACRHCAVLYGAAGVFYLLLAGAVLLAHPAGQAARALVPGLAGQPLPALASGLVLLFLAGLLMAGGQAMLRPALAGAVLHALAWAATGAILAATGPSPVAVAGLVLAWTGLVSGALLADAARQSLGSLHACAQMPSGA